MTRPTLRKGAPLTKKRRLGYKRPGVGLLLSAGALVLLLSFRTPASLAPPATAGGSLSAAFSGTLSGPTVDTPYGPVQVQVTIAAGKITEVTTLQVPKANQYSSEVAAYATPRLRSEVLSAQSAAVDTISGATYTSGAYLQSLQSALDQARA